MSKPEGKYVIELNADQIRVVRAALDMYARMGTGQLEVTVDEFIRRKFSDRVIGKQVIINPKRGLANDPTYTPIHKDLCRVVLDHVGEIKRLVWHHPLHGSWSIHNEKVPQECREAYDIRQKLDMTINSTEFPDEFCRGYHPCNPDTPPVSVRFEAKEDG